MFKSLGFAVLATALALSCAGAASAAPPPIEAYGRLPQSEAFELSPSGHRLAFIGDREGARAIYVVGEGKLIALAKLTDKADNGKTSPSKVLHVDWADEDHVLVWRSRTYNLGMDYGFKHEIDEVYVMDLKTQKSFHVFEHADKLFFGVFGGFGYAHKDGHAYGYFEGQPLDDEGVLTNETPELYRVSLDDGRIEIVAPDVMSRNWLIGTDGVILANSEYDSRSGDWRLYAGPHKDALVAASKNPFDSDGIAGEGRTPGTVLYLVHDEAGGAEYFEAPLANPGDRTRMFEDVEAADPLFDRETNLLIGVRSGGETPEYTFFDPHKEAVWKGTQKAFPGLHVSLLSYNTAFNTLFVYTDGDGDSGSYWTVDIATGKARFFGAAYPDVSATDVGPRKYVQYKAADGLDLEGVLTLPPGRDAKNLPVVILPHGGPRWHDTLDFDWIAEAFASRGYAVFQPNFRGSTGYGADFVRAGYGEWGRKMQTDVSDGLAYLAAQGVVDPKRACIVGASYGGYVALAGVTVQQGLYRCAVSVAGVSDLKVMLAAQADEGETRSPAVRYWKTAIGATTVTDSFLNDLSPARLASRADAPVLLIHGKDDTSVPIDQSRIMLHALQSARKPVEMVELDGEDHNLARETTRIAMLKAAMAFVEKYNPPN